MDMPEARKALGWVDVHDPRECRIEEDLALLTSVRPERERPADAALGRYEGSHCVTTCAVVPADEYDRLAIDASKVAAVEALVPMDGSAYAITTEDVRAALRRGVSAALDGAEN